MLVKVRPLYPSANLPRVALSPASLSVLGATTSTPSPLVVRPVLPEEGDAGNAGCIVPQMSKASAPCQVVPTVGSTDEEVWS